MDELKRKESFLQRGWCTFPVDPVLGAWVEAALPVARELVSDASNSQWFRHGNTWFAGVNVMPNSDDGTVGSSAILSGHAVSFIREQLGINEFSWDKGQLSICYPGYPQPMAEESETAFNYRKRRDAAHVDGLIPEGPLRRRHLREHHGFILGIPMTTFNEQASPFVVWEGSHEIVRATFNEAFNGLAADQWGDMDVTKIYQQARKTIFVQCRRRVIHCQPGESFLVHRLALHGIAPWGDAGLADSDGRMICYFRPEYGGPEIWLNAP